MEIFITVVVLAIVVLAIKYLLDHQKSKSTPVSEAPAEEAPYKVETPVELATAVDVSPELVAKAAQTVSAAPELKVVTGAKKPAARSRVARAKKAAATKPAAKPVVAKPATPKKPRQPKA